VHSLCKYAQSQNIGNPKSIKVFMNKNTKGPTPRKSKSLISEGHLNAHLVSRGEVNIEKAYFFRYFPVSYLYKT
jgi:hypothetical protein